MVLLSLLTASCFASSVRAWLPLLPTVAEDNRHNIEGWTPEPTPKPGQDILYNILPARQASTTSQNRIYGYWNADGSNPLQWGLANSYCAFNPLIRGAACCPSTTAPGNSCSYYTSCVASSDVNACDSQCQMDPYITKCMDSNLPNCFTLTYTDITYSNINCAASGGIDQVARYPTKNIGDIDTDALSALLFVTETPLPTSEISSSAASVSGSTTIASSSSSSSAPTSSTSPSSSSQLSHGDIIGAVIGIVGALATIAGTLYTRAMYNQKQKKRREGAISVNTGNN